MEEEYCVSTKEIIFILLIISNENIWGPHLK